MASDSDLPYRPRPGDVVVSVPHTLTRATRTGLDAAARAVLPSASSFSRTAPDPRLVLDARACTVVDADGLATLCAVLRAAAASGVGAVIVDMANDVARQLARAPAARGLTLAFAARPPAPAHQEPAEGAVEGAVDEPAPEATREAAPSDHVVVLALDDDARRRLGRRRRR